MAETDAANRQQQPAKLTMPTMAAMVVGSMVGAGVFSLPGRFSEETGVAGALIAWAVAGAGMLMLAFVFQSLAVQKPELDAGVYAYAKAGFGEYLGFFAAFGYWASACVGNVMPVGNGVVLMGMSERTSRHAITQVAASLFRTA